MKLDFPLENSDLPDDERPLDLPLQEESKPEPSRRTVIEYMRKGFGGHLVPKKDNQKN